MFVSKLIQSRYCTTMYDKHDMYLNFSLYQSIFSILNNWWQWIFNTICVLFDVSQEEKQTRNKFCAVFELYRIIRPKVTGMGLSSDRKRRYDFWKRTLWRIMKIVKKSKKWATIGFNIRSLGNKCVTRYAIGRYSGIYRCGVRILSVVAGMSTPKRSKSSPELHILLPIQCLSTILFKSYVVPTVYIPG